MGEIGKEQDEFLYGYCLWQLRAVIDGYYRRSRELWSGLRWQTYNLMCVSHADLRSAGIYKPTDLLSFPWEDDDSEVGEQISNEEIQRLRQMMAEENERLKEGRAT